MPFKNRHDKAELAKEMLDKQVYIDYNVLASKDKFTKASIDFVNKLLLNDQFKRLGAKGISQVKNHAYLKGFDWVGMKNKTLDSPLKKSIGLL